jgi:RNA polymerase sigma-70 factor (ECF subfamily)
MKLHRPPRDSSSEEFIRDFEAFYRRHFVAVSRYVARRLPPNSHDEVVAAAVVVAGKKFSDVDSPSLPWLYRIASFEVSHERRRLGREPSLVALSDIGSTDRYPLTDVMDMSTGFAQLSEGDQEVLRLVFWEDLTRIEAAEVLDCSVNTLNVRVHRALEHLRGAISRTESTKGNIKNHQENKEEES